MKVEHSSFMGPTLAAAALCFLMPLTRPAERRRWNVNDKSVLVTSRYDQHLVALIWFVFLLSLFAWAAACYFSVEHSTHRTLGQPTHIVIGAAAYVASLVLASVKERT